jgi:hypothetical protein
VTAHARLLSVLSLAMSLLFPLAGRAQISVSISVAPPPLPVYEQPAIPDSGYIWTPGYWSYGPDGYFWVPGTWVQPPQYGLLWTPGYWAWSDGAFVWVAGYWAPEIGFYGGVNYGFGYPGHGYEGGYWRDRNFYYNRTVNNITDVHVTNVYTKTVVNDVTVNRVSYVGGTGGVVARPTSQEEQVAHAPHTPPTAVQTQHREAAGARRDLLASVNQGKPAIAATAKPTEFSSHVVSATRAGGPVPAATTKRAAAPPPAVSTAPARPTAPAPPTSVPAHVRDLPKYAPTAVPPASATAEEKEYARQQTALQARQNQERQALAQQQERDHANFARSPGNAEQQAAMERQHQQQTQQLQQRHTTEQKDIAKPTPHPPSPHEPNSKEPSSHENPR